MEITREVVKSNDLISKRKKILWDDAGAEMGAMYGELMKYAGTNKVEMIAPPVCLAHQWDENGGDVECGLVIENQLDGTDEIRASKTYEGNVAVIIHIGPYKNTSESWEKLFQYIKDNSLEINGVPWEEYITDPAKETDPEKYVTKLYQPIK